MAKRASAFTPAEVLSIRSAHDAGTLDVRAWADLKSCSLETIRRIGRRDTHRELASAAAEPSLSDIQASLARLDAVSKETPPQAPQVNDLLDELKGRTNGQAH